MAAAANIPVVLAMCVAVAYLNGAAGRNTNSSAAGAAGAAGVSGHAVVDAAWGPLPSQQHVVANTHTAGSTRTKHYSNHTTPALGATTAAAAAPRATGGATSSSSSLTVSQVVVIVFVTIVIIGVVLSSVVCLKANTKASTTANTHAITTANTKASTTANTHASTTASTHARYETLETSDDSSDSTNTSRPGGSLDGDAVCVGVAREASYLAPNSDQPQLYEELKDTHTHAQDQAQDAHTQAQAHTQAYTPKKASPYNAVFVHGPISRAQAETSLCADSDAGAVPGLFLIRTKHGAGTSSPMVYALSICTSAPSAVSPPYFAHHILAWTPRAGYMLNDHPLSKVCHSLQDVIAHLSSPASTAMAVKPTTGVAANVDGFQKTTSEGDDKLTLAGTGSEPSARRDSLDLGHAPALTHTTRDKSPGKWLPTRGKLRNNEVAAVDGGSYMTHHTEGTLSGDRPAGSHAEDASLHAGGHRPRPRTVYQARRRDDVDAASSGHMYASPGELFALVGGVSGSSSTDHAYEYELPVTMADRQQEEGPAPAHVLAANLLPMPPANAQPFNRGGGAGPKLTLSRDGKSVQIKSIKRKNPLFSLASETTARALPTASRASPCGAGSTSMQPAISVDSPVGLYSLLAGGTPLYEPLTPGGGTLDLPLRTTSSMGKEHSFMFPQPIPGIRPASTTRHGSSPLTPRRHTHCQPRITSDV